MTKGQVNVPEQTTCVVKFYSNGCHLCRTSSYYKDISDKYEDVMFLLTM